MTSSRTRSSAWTHARSRRREVDRAIAAWRGFEQPPPRSVLTVDALRDELDAANQAVASAAETRKLLQAFEAEFSSKLKAAQGEARLAGEAADRARGSPEYARLDWQRNLARLKADVDGATEALLQLGLRAAQADYEAAVAQRDFARHKLIDAGSELALPAGDLDKVVAEVELRRLAAERALRAATKASAAADAASAALELRRPSKQRRCPRLPRPPPSAPARRSSRASLPPRRIRRCSCCASN